MQILQPGMNEQNVTIDQVVDASNAIVEQLKQIVLDESKRAAMVESFTAYYAELDGAQYVPEVRIHSGPYPSLVVMGVSHGKIDMEFYIALDRDADCTEFYLSSFLCGGYALRLERALAHSFLSGVIKYDYPPSEPPKSFEFGVKLCDCGHADAIQQRGRWTFCNRYSGAEREAQHAEFVQSRGELGESVEDMPPYHALEVLDCFANTVLGFDVLVPEVENEYP